MAISLDATSENGYESGSDPISWSHTIGSGSDRLLVVAVSVDRYNTGSDPVSDVTYNSTSGTRAVADDDTKTFAQLWYWLDTDLPSTGSYTVQVDFNTSSLSSSCAAISVDGAAQEAPEATDTPDEPGGESAGNMSITTLTDNAWVIDVLADTQANKSYSTSSGQTEYFDTSGGLSSGAGSYLEVSTAGAQDCDWSRDGGGSPDTQAVIAIAPSTGATTKTLTASLNGAVQQQGLTSTSSLDGVLSTSGVSRNLEGFRWRDDDGSESSASWLAAQDTNITRQVNTNTRLRLLTDIASGDAPSEALKLQYRKSGGTWKDVPVEGF